MGRGAEPMRWEVITGECTEVMATMEPASVDAIVVSPPYADQRARDESGTYIGEARITERVNRQGRKPGAKNQSRRQRSAAPMEFVEWFMPKLEAMRPLLRPRGSLMLNLGVIMRDGEESPYADEILRRAREAGWKLLHRQVWHKPNGNCLSDRKFLTIAHEWVFWLAPGTDAFRGYVGGYPNEPASRYPGYDRMSRRPHAEETLRRMRRGGFLCDPNDERYAGRERWGRGRGHELHPDGANPTTVLTHGVGGERGIRHPAPMSLGLALDLVRRACPLGGTVLDPMCGSGTTLVAAKRTGRASIGIESNPEHAEEARARIAADTPLFDAAKDEEETSAEQQALEIGGSG
jgi:DNA modification methylase